MKKLSLNEHIEQSKKAVAANRAKGNRHGLILTQLYADPYRFLEEILQNTEDAYAAVDKKGIILFKLTKESLYIGHNGKVFDEEDLKSITTYAASTKQKREYNEIGKFGIGFKSVFAICKRPEIHSGEYHFAIRDFEVLEKQKPIEDLKEFTSVFKLPFTTDEESYNIVFNGLKKIKASHLLFLNQLKQIDIKIAEETWSISKTEIETSDRIKMISISERDTEEKYLLYKNDKNNSKHIAFAFAYKKEEDKILFTKVKESPLFVYFSTLEYTGLDFLIHANFSTTPTREKISFDKESSAENLRLLHETETHLQKALKEMASERLLNLSLISLLPLSIRGIKSAIHPVFAAINIFCLKAFKKYSLIPSSTKTYTSSEKILIKSEKNFPELFSKKEIQRFFGGFLFVEEEIVEMPELMKTFMQDLGIKELSPEKWAFHIMLHPYILEKKSDQWFLHFYHVLKQYPFLWNEENQDRYYSLRDKAMIYCQDKKMRKAFDEKGKAIVFRDFGKIRNAMLVRRKLLSDEAINSFFIDIGIPEYDKNSVVETEQDMSLLTRSLSLSGMHLCLVDEKEVVTEELISVVKNKLSGKYPHIIKSLPGMDYDLIDNANNLYITVFRLRGEEMKIRTKDWTFCIEENKKQTQSCVLWVFVYESLELKIIEDPISSLLSGKILPQKFVIK
jgi:hypothetical protein